jgi:hypothetical protein
MELIRNEPATQVGRFAKPGKEVSMQINGSLQPTGTRTRELFPEGTINSDSMSLYIKGKVDVENGDFIITDDNIRYKVIALEADWADLGNYRKYLVEKVKA